MTKNQLKLLAAAAMVLDHIGAAILPQLALLRIIGRISFPIFSYSVYEGCKYTHNRKRYFLQMLGMGALCTVGFFAYSGVVFANVLITFSLSILLLCSLFRLEEDVRNKCRARYPEDILLLMTALFGAVLVCRMIEVDYGFMGVLLPIWPELFDFAGECFSKSSPKQRKALHLLGMISGLLLLAYALLDIQKYQLFGLLAIVPLALYSGAEGHKKLKYFFYYFYPAHLLAIGGLAALIGN